MNYSADLTKYADFFKVEFVDFHGVIFAKYPGMKLPPKRRIPTTTDERRRFELEENHLHCDFSVGDTPRDRWLNNLALGQALQKYYQLKLRTTFPDRNVVFSLLNEMVIYCEPTAPLWKS